MKPIYLVVLLALAVASSLFYRAEGIETELACQNRIAEINRLSAESLKQSEDKIHDLETDRIAQNQDADTRLQALRKRLDSAIKNKPPIQAGIGLPDCSVGDDVIRVLTEAAADPRLSSPDNPAGFVDPEETVTADTVAAYSFYTIEQYNQCASDMNSLQNMVR